MRLERMDNVLVTGVVIVHHQGEDEKTGLWDSCILFYVEPEMGLYLH